MTSLTLEMCINYSNVIKKLQWQCKDYQYNLCAVKNRESKLI